MAWGSFGASSPVVMSLGWLGAFGACALFLSPVPTLRRIVREKSVLDFDHTPYVVSLIQCALWVTYTAMLPGLIEPMVTNIVGVCLELTYCAIFVRFRTACLRDVAAATTTFGLVVCLAHIVPFPRLAGATPRASLIGVLASLVNVLMYASPLNVTRVVVRTKSVEFMPLSLTLGTLACSACWAAYAFTLGDFFIFVPSVLGVALALCQLLIYSWYSQGPVLPSSKS